MKLNCDFEILSQLLEYSDCKTTHTDPVTLQQIINDH